VDTAAAEPQKNQIRLAAECDNGQEYRFIINGMSNVGQIRGGNNNFAIKRFTVTYFEPPPSDAYIASDSFGQGIKEGLQRDLINCTGNTTTELQGLGRVTAVYAFEGIILPRGANSKS
jgi:hypothetical protein